jgi:hypothetical protein
VEQASSALIAQYRHEGWRAFRAPSPCSKAQGRSRWAPRFFARRAAAGGQSFHRRPRARLAPHHLLDPLEGRDTARAKATLLPGGYRLVVAADLEDLEAIDRAILAILPSPCWRCWRWAWGALVLARYLRPSWRG